MLVHFALSERFDRELATVLERAFPDGVIRDETALTMVLDHFALQYKLISGDTVLDHFVMAHPELSPGERDMLLGWKDVVEGVFEVRGKDKDALILFNVIDELTYRTRSNMGKTVFRPIKKGMFVVGRLVPVGDDWMISGNPAVFPAKNRDVILAQAAELSMRSPESVFRNPEKLATARRILAEQRELFIELYGDELIVVPGSALSEQVNAFWRAVAAKAQPEAEPTTQTDLALPDEVTAAETVAIHFDPDTGLSFYVDFGLLQEAFDNPALIIRQRYRETLTGYLRDDDIPPAPIRLLAERDPEKASLRLPEAAQKREFSWDQQGESLLRKYKARYFDTPQLPSNVPVGEEMARHFRNLKR